MTFVVPDACTLPRIEQPLRLAAFGQLFASSVRQADTISPTHARIRLTGPAGLEATVRDLTDRETACCSFFTFAITSEAAGDGEALILDVQVPDQYTDVLGSLIGQASAAVAAR